MKKSLIISLLVALTAFSGCTQTDDNSSSHNNSVYLYNHETNNNSDLYNTLAQEQQLSDCFTTENSTVPQDTSVNDDEDAEERRINDDEEAEEIRKHPYSQLYPVQDYQKAYAEFVRSFNEELNSGTGSLKQKCSAYMIHIDGDTIPELSVQYSVAGATLYGFDGTEVYKIGDIGADYNTMDFSYRPYLGMFSYYTGSVMLSSRHLVVHVIEEENGRLKHAEKLHIGTPDEYGYCSIPQHIQGFENTIPYDIINQRQGESWRKLPDEAYITDSAIEYWINNYITE